jgi:N utilization substance protein B
MALQALYEIDCTGHRVDEVLGERLLEEPLGQRAESFLTTLVKGVVQNQAALDRLIHQHAPDWPVEQMAIIDRNILRIAIYELALSEKIPLKVAINEAVVLAKTFGSDSTPRFINGVLGTLSTKQEQLISALKAKGNYEPSSEGD